MKKSLSRRAVLKTIGSASAIALSQPASLLAQTAALEIAGKPVEITVSSVSPDTVRLSIAPLINGQPQPIPHDGALLQQTWSKPLARITSLSRAQQVRSGNLIVKFAPDPLTIRIEAKDGRLVQQLRPDVQTGALTFSLGDRPVLALGEGGAEFVLVNAETLEKKPAFDHAKLAETLATITWSPDAKKLAVFRVRPGYHRKLQYVESSPRDQVQPHYGLIEYAKPGDALDLPQPIMFDVENKRQYVIDNTLCANPYQMSRPEWRKDSRAFTFEYNQRGHQVYRIIEVNAATGKPRAVISEEPKTFFTYSSKKYRADINDGKEVVWMSERDGWNHLYLFDGVTGAVKNQLTKGSWVVRGVEKVDEEKRQIWFQASGMHAGKDPYLIHYFRINFDGTGLTPLTEADANHSVSFSSDMKFYVDTYSRVDHPTIAELRRTEDRKVLTELERGDITELTKAGWRAPEVFSALGRDGKTDIWGVIFRPINYDPLKKYPVIEYIYAGPHSSHVPKSFSAYNQMQSLAELGFIVVQIDGMGTSNRSKAFHDVAWKNLGDAGFPDRILWHQAVAAKYRYYDISRVGIYGTSAGGQNSLGALLFHPEFYKVCVSACGCHDNRMDKIWWNEQ